MDDNSQRVEARINEELFRYFESSERVTCTRADTRNVDMNIVCRWELRAEEVVERYKGDHLIGERFPDNNTAEAAAQAYIEQINNGESQPHSAALLDFIHNNRLEAVWGSSYKLEDDRQISCKVVCGACAGEGQIECSICAGKGRINCFQCGGRGQIECTTCHGSGSTPVYDGQRTVYRTCGECMGSCRVRCPSWDCLGGIVTCNTCSGKGLLACDKCSGTGYFIITRKFAVSGFNEGRTISWRDAPDWIVQYIKEAANNRGTHPLPPEQTIGISPPDIRFNTDYPYELEAPGTLPATAATVRGADERESHCAFIGEELHPLDLGRAGDGIGTQLARLVLSNMTDMEKLPVLLHINIYGTLLPLRHNAPPDLAGIYPFRIRLLSEEVGTDLLRAYHAVVEHYKKARSVISIKSWLGLSAIWALGLFILLTLINAIYIGQLDWSETGFTASHYWQNLWEEAQGNHPGGTSSLTNFMEFLGAQPPPFFLHLCICAVAGYCLAKLFFLTQRALTYRRFTGEVLIGTSLGIVLFLLFQPAFQGVTAVTDYPPGMNELMAGAVLSLSLVPEVVVLGIFAGFFHGRRNSDRRVRRQIRNISIPALEQDLGYAKQG